MICKSMHFQTLIPDFKITITFDALDQFQENKVCQTAQTMNNILKSKTKWELCHHGNRDLLN